MTKDDILQQWSNLNEICKQKLSQLYSFNDNWLNDIIELSNEQWEQEATKLNQEIDELERQMNQLLAEHTKMCVEEARKEQNLKDSKAFVQNQFGVNPDEIKITDGVLSSNAQESHLTGVSKTPEQLEQERQLLLSRIKDQVMKKAITLGEASQWKNYINTAYGFSAPIQEMNNGMQR